MDVGEGGIASGGRVSCRPSPRCGDREAAGKMGTTRRRVGGDRRRRSAVARRTGATSATGIGAAWRVLGEGGNKSGGNLVNKNLTCTTHQKIITIL